MVSTHVRILEVSAFHEPDKDDPPLPARAAEAARASALPPELVTTATTNTPAETDQALRAYLRVQEQLHATLLAVEQARLESSQEARAHSEALAARLDVLERTLADQREQRWQTMQDSNRTMLVLAGSVVGLGIIALTLT